MEMKKHVCDQMKMRQIAGVIQTQGEDNMQSFASFEHDCCHLSRIMRRSSEPFDKSRFREYPIRAGNCKGSKARAFSVLL
jgi:hypothetical protein